LNFFLFLFDVNFFNSSSHFCFVFSQSSSFFIITLSTLISYLSTMTISIEKRQLIISQHQKGKTTKEIADYLEVELRTVQNILKQHKETGDITPKTSTGRHRLLSPRDERGLYLEMRRHPNLKPSTLRHSLPKKVSPQTITRSLNRAGLHPYKMRRKPRLTAAQRHARLEWAKEYAKKPANFWDNVIFSDESSFHTHEAVRGRYVWRFTGEELDPKMVQPVTKFGGHKLQVWGCITSKGVGYPCSLPEGIDGPTYLTILKDELVSTIDHYFVDFKGVIFQQDGAGPHRAKVVQDFFRRQKYTVLPWPAHSPDLSPIENLWAHLKKRLEENHGEIRKAELWKVVEDEWNITSEEYLKRLFASMPERLAAVIKAKGGYTRY